MIEKVNWFMHGNLLFGIYYLRHVFNNVKLPNLPGEPSSGTILLRDLKKQTYKEDWTQLG